MGLICNQLEGTSNNEVNNEDSKTTSNSLNNISRRRRKPIKQSKPRNFLHSLFRWYFKSRAALQDDYSQSPKSDYEISIDALNCNEDESSLAYRQHKIRTASTKPSQASSSSSSNLSHSHYLVRQSICLYASSVILALCYLTTPSSAAESPSHPV